MIGEDGLILDTHAWIWWINEDMKLPETLREKIFQARRVSISAVSLYEMIQAVERGRLQLACDVSAWMPVATSGADIGVVPVDESIARIAAELPRIHGDPLDRFIIATSLSTGFPLVSLDGRFREYNSLKDLLVRE